MPYYREKLLSAWGNERPFEVGRAPPKVDPDIERNLQPARFGSIAHNPAKVRRNQVDRVAVLEFNGNTNLNRRSAGAKSKNGDGRRIGEAAETLNNLALAGAIKPDVPLFYTNVKITYDGRHGITDFDFLYVSRASRMAFCLHSDQALQQNVLLWPGD